MSQSLTGIITWLKDWFYDKEEFDSIIDNIQSGGTITTLTLVPYAENPNGVICYEGGDNPTPTSITVDSVSLTSTKSILSYADSESTTLSATVLDNNEDGIEGLEVNFLKGGVSIGTAITDENGVATKTYTANGDGELTFKAAVNNVEDELTIIDAKFYASNSAIDSQATTFDNHNVAFFDYAIQYDETVYFKFNTKPTHCLIGIGSSSQSGLVWEFNTNSTKCHRNYGSASSYSVNWLDSTSEFDIKVTYNGTRARGDIYRDKVYWDYWQFNLTSTVQKLRIDKFPNDDYDIEVYVL